MDSALLDEIYQKYEIPTLIATRQTGKLHDKLGDAYEEFCLRILNDNDLLERWRTGNISDSLEARIFYEMLTVNGVSSFYSIESISATNHIPHRESGGLAKTDIHAIIRFYDAPPCELAISCKQSSASKVAIAEFDSDTICREVGIDDEVVQRLLEKHQRDASAKNFTKKEKIDLTEHLQPYGRSFVRWTLTGSPIQAVQDIRIPTSIMKFQLSKPKAGCQLQSFKIVLVEDYIDQIMYNRNGVAKRGGFGTGLSFTYATGSKGQKIQFKG